MGGRVVEDYAIVVRPLGAGSATDAST